MPYLDLQIYLSFMSFAGLKAGVDRLSAEECLQLRAYLTLKDEIPDDVFMKGLSEKINDRNPEHWVTLEEFEKLVEI